MFAHIRILTCWLGVFGFSALIALPAYSQNDPFNRSNTNPSRSLLNDPFNRSNTSPNRSLLNDPIIRVNPGIGNSDGTPTYPYSSRINELGWIKTPRGQVIYPSVGIKHGDGSTTYYYPNGTNITIDKSKLPATGGFLR